MSAEDLRTTIITQFVHVFLNLRGGDQAIWVYKKGPTPQWPERALLDTKTLPKLRLSNCNPFFIIGNIVTMDVRDRALS